MLALLWYLGLYHPPVRLSPGRIYYRTHRAGYARKNWGRGWA